MSVKDPHADYNKYLPQWTRCNDVASGRDAILAKGKEYLPILSDQDDEEYAAYQMRATFFNATWRTINGMQGMIFRKPPKVDVPDSIKPLVATVTTDGQSLQVLAMDVTEESLKTGRVGILVDYPTVATQRATLADVKAQNLRPVMNLYEAVSILNWRETVVNNVTVLSMVILAENHDVRESEFSVKTVKRYRVLDLTDAGQYRVRLFMVDDQNRDIQIGSDAYPQMNGNTMNFIPFYFIGVDDTCVDVDEPPLIDLVDLNLAHYRVSADYENGCHFCGLPTPVFAGFDINEGDKVILGSSKGIIAANPQANATFLETSGAGLPMLENNLAMKERQMAVMGARMLEQRIRGVESAETAQIHRAAEISVLSSMAQTISIGMTSALKTFCQWQGAEPNALFELNRDFMPTTMDATTLTALLAQWQAGGISKETYFDNLKAGEIIGTEITFEEEESRISNNPPDLSGGAPTKPAPAKP